ncbi:MAG: hypothetical protein WEB52_01955 [Dehalococcoidia bacterium]
MPLETWDVWYPDAAAAGLSFALGCMERADAIMIHAAPNSLRIEVRDEAGERVAFVDRLKREGRHFPMTRIRRRGETLVREDEWPQDEDIGRPVLLPGGEVGILKQWWNAEDGSEWRWTVEFYNHR